MVLGLNVGSDEMVGAALAEPGSAGSDSLDGARDKEVGIFLVDASAYAFLDEEADVNVLGSA